MKFTVERATSLNVAAVLQKTLSLRLDKRSNCGSRTTSLREQYHWLYQAGVCPVSILNCLLLSLEKPLYPTICALIPALVTGELWPVGLLLPVMLCVKMFWLNKSRSLLSSAHSQRGPLCRSSMMTASDGMPSEFYLWGLPVLWCLEALCHLAIFTTSASKPGASASWYTALITTLGCSNPADLDLADESEVNQDVISRLWGWPRDRWMCLWSATWVGTSLLNWAVWLKIEIQRYNELLWYHLEACTCRHYWQNRTSTCTCT